MAKSINNYMNACDAGQCMALADMLAANPNYKHINPYRLEDVAYDICRIVPMTRGTIEIDDQEAIFVITEDDIIYRLPGHLKYQLVEYYDFATGAYDAQWLVWHYAPNSSDGTPVLTDTVLTSLNFNVVLNAINAEPSKR